MFLGLELVRMCTGTSRAWLLQPMTGRKLSLTGTRRWRTSPAKGLSLSSSPPPPGTTPSWSGRRQTGWGAGQHLTRRGAGSLRSMFATTGQMVTFCKEKCTKQERLALLVDRASSAQRNTQGSAVITSIWYLLRIWMYYLSAWRIWIATQVPVSSNQHLQPSSTARSNNYQISFQSYKETDQLATKLHNTEQFHWHRGRSWTIQLSFWQWGIRLWAKVSELSHVAQQ